MSEKQDLRVIRTHKLIRNALIELLKNHEFEKISVQEIIELAMVNRATFYKYYSGKSDLAGAMIADFKTQHQAMMQQRFSGDPSDIRMLMTHTIPALHEERQLILALWKIKTKRHHLYDDTFAMIKQNYIAYQTAQNPHKNWDYQGEILANIVLATTKYYFEQDLPVPIKHVEKELADVINFLQQNTT